MWAEVTTVGWALAAVHGVGPWWLTVPAAGLEAWVFGIAYARCGGRSWDGETPTDERREPAS